MMALVVANRRTQVVAGGVAVGFDDQPRREIVRRQDRSLARGSGPAPERCRARARCRSREPTSGRGSSRCRRRRLACPGSWRASPAGPRPARGCPRGGRASGGRWIETTFEPVIKIGAEPVRGDLGRQVLVGRRQQPGLKRDRARRADRQDFLVLDRPQQLGLGRPRQLADLVEKDGPAARPRRTTRRGRDRPR